MSWPEPLQHPLGRQRPCSPDARAVWSNSPGHARLAAAGWPVLALRPLCERTTIHRSAPGADRPPGSTTAACLPRWSARPLAPRARSPVPRSWFPARGWPRAPLPRSTWSYSRHCRVRLSATYTPGVSPLAFSCSVSVITASSNDRLSLACPSSGRKNCGTPSPEVISASIHCFRSSR